MIGARTATGRARARARPVAEGKLRPRIHAVLPLAEAQESHRILESSEQFGRVVLTP